MCVVTNNDYFWLQFWNILDVFSLEEEDGFMVISQNNENGDRGIVQNGILGEPTDFKSPVRGVMSGGEALYSDISDDDMDFQIPSSQRYFQPNEAEKG